MGVKERRRQSRSRAASEVLLFVEEPLACRIPARLIEASSRGFRAAHHFAALAVGQEIRFRHEDGQGRARIVWTRVLPSHVETGFVLLQSL